MCIYDFISVALELFEMCSAYIPKYVNVHVKCFLMQLLLGHTNNYDKGVNCDLK